MTIDTYQELTGRTVSSSKEALISSTIRKTQRMLERMLGYTLNYEDINDNQYVESGKTQTECPCPDDDLTLDPPDAVVTAYRLFPYNSSDRYLFIDPASKINAVKLVKDDVTYKTIESDEYRADYKNGIIQYLDQVECWCDVECCNYCEYVQLAVDADWLWDEDETPEELLDVWAEMVSFYSNKKRYVISETLGPHSYRQSNAGNTPPEMLSHNLKIIKYYAGPNGTATQMPTT
jgi:hypothetical protein